MNKIKQNALALIAGSFLLTSCGLSLDDDYVGGDFGKLVQKEQEWNDSIDVIDNIGIEDNYKQRLYSHKNENFDFKAKGSLNEIHVGARIECNGNGGNMTIYCIEQFRDESWQYGPEIIFKNLKGNKMTNADGYTVRMLDSLEIGKKTYRDVLEFDATEAENNGCNYDKFYISAVDGLLRIDLLDSIKIERQ